MFYHTPPSFNAVPDNNDYFVAGTAFQRQNPDDFKGFSSKNRGIAPNHAKFSHFDQYDRRDGQK
jgi:hypothetical protein